MCLTDTVNAPLSKFLAPKLISVWNSWHIYQILTGVIIQSAGTQWRNEGGGGGGCRGGQLPPGAAGEGRKTGGAK